MELPGLGAQCLEPSCKQLDFLPMRCDACGSIFCKDHFRYSDHGCREAHLKDNQVPVCPLCNQPVPVSRGEVPDVRVSAHIDNECTDDRATSRKRTIYTNRCNVRGCRQKELIPVLCSECKVNFCLRHRHPADHVCDPRSKRIPASASFHKSLAASASASVSAIRTSASAAASSASRHFTDMFKQRPASSAPSTPMSEDEALARAIRASMQSAAAAAGPGAAGAGVPVVDLTDSPTRSKSLQEEEDRQLAMALAESERSAGSSSGRSTTRQNSNDKCQLS